MENCIFCQIVKGTIPSSKVYSDEQVFAFLDIQPVNLGHVLVIPKVHAPQLSDLEEEVGGHMFRVAMRVSAALRRSGLKCEGVNLYLADGQAASQEIFHVHLHVIPRFKGDEFGLKFGPQYGSKLNSEELDAVAQRIAKAIR